ncbi:MAG: PQQ-like beta-propeller repeat protein [Bacteroidetes bacterium]|nr:PQQ-like beta-propeller repeat protein [Bacteroidota bacterium]
MKLFIASLSYLLLLLLVGCDTTEPTAPPTTPRVIRGTDSARVDERVEVLIVSDDPEQKSLTYEVDWGDGRPMDSYAEIESGLWYTISHHYFEAGLFTMRCRAVNAAGRLSDWSAPFRITVVGGAITGKGDWWMFMRDAQHSGHSPFAGPSIPVLAWRLKSSSPIRSSASFDAAGTAYIGGDDFLLRAVYLDGSVKWTYNTGSAWIRNAPALYSDGSLSFGSSSANIYRIARNGVKQWNTSVNAAVLRSNAVVDEEGNIYIGSTDNGIYALRPDGTLRWRYPTSAPVEGSPALGRDEATVYVGSRDHILYALGTDGQLKWSFPTEAPFSGSPTVGPTEQVYIGDEAGWLFALRPDGKLAWRLNLHSPIITTPAATREGFLHVLTTEGKLYRIDNDGTVQWTVSVSLAGGEASPIVDVNGVIYVAAPDGQLTAVSSGGSILWRYQTGDAIQSTPAIGPDGSIAFGSDDGYFYVLKER